MSRYYIETYGCQMNSAESNALEALLEGSGWTASNEPENADLAVINTCSVRQSAENRIWGRLGSYKPIKERRELTLVVTGCMADRLGDSIKKRAPQVDYVVPVNDKMKILEIAALETTANFGFSPSDRYEFTSSYWKEGQFSSYVPIMNGCNNFCTYCIVPYVRGREVSRNPDQILDEVSMLDEKGVKEITLLGQNVNSYSYGNIGFPQLLERVCDRLHNIEWVRFESPHPKDFSDSLISVIAGRERIAKHIHLPMQSGSTRILGLMNRRYTRRSYLELTDRIREQIPDVTFALDVMVGFPGEIASDFEDTLSAVKYVGCIEAFMYYWNPREGTRAVDMEGQLSDREKQQRLQELIDFQLANAAALKSRRIGKVWKVLVLSVSRDNPNQMLGRNEHNENVAFTPLDPLAPPAVGSMVDVSYQFLNGSTFVGKQV